ncbi:hypothetical protein OK074_7380 [Actinobacteria bacterium OK074]|nr:hypothetical protein OK074_7380 [Actinobacteria bacterium OK074]
MTSVIHGLFQTEAYARALIAGGGGGEHFDCRGDMTLAEIPKHDHLAYPWMDPRESLGAIEQLAGELQ